MHTVKINPIFEGPSGEEESRGSPGWGHKQTCDLFISGSYFMPRVIHLLHVYKRLKGIPGFVLRWSRIRQKCTI